MTRDVEAIFAELGDHAPPPEVQAFLADLAMVCRKHGLSLAHEDDQGAFLVVPWSEDDELSLLVADDRVPRRPCWWTVPRPVCSPVQPDTCGKEPDARRHES